MNLHEIKKRMESQGVGFTDPVSEADLDRIEKIYGITFPKALREFYKEGIPFSKNEYDFPAWNDFSKENIKKIKERIEALRGWLLHDVQNGYWIEPWGSRPDRAKKAVNQVAALADRAPKLIPIFSHRSIPLIDGLDDPPVISAAGRDIIYYGSNLADYLEREFADKTGAFEVSAKIPFWGDIINANETAFERQKTAVFEKFEKRVMLEIIKENPEYAEKLLRQYQNGKVILRRFTGHGFFTDFFVSDPEATLGDGVNLELGDLQANLNDMQHGVGFVLFVRNGLIDCLEGYAYVEPWPDVIYRYEIPYNG